MILTATVLDMAKDVSQRQATDARATGTKGGGDDAVKLSRARKEQTSQIGISDEASLDAIISGADYDALTLAGLTPKKARTMYDKSVKAKDDTLMRSDGSFYTFEQVWPAFTEKEVQGVVVEETDEMKEEKRVAEATGKTVEEIRDLYPTAPPEIAEEEAKMIEWVKANTAPPVVEPPVAEPPTEEQSIPVTTEPDSNLTEKQQQNVKDVDRILGGVTSVIDSAMSYNQSQTDALNAIGRNDSPEKIWEIINEDPSIADVSTIKEWIKNNPREADAAPKETTTNIDDLKDMSASQRKRLTPSDAPNNLTQNNETVNDTDLTGVTDSALQVDTQEMIPMRSDNNRDIAAVDSIQGAYNVAADIKSNPTQTDMETALLSMRDMTPDTLGANPEVEVIMERYKREIKEKGLTLGSEAQAVMNEYDRLQALSNKTSSTEPTLTGMVA
jgi:hypothetical protein